MFPSPQPHHPQGMMTLYTPTFLMSHHMMYASPPPPYSPNHQYLNHNPNHESRGDEYQNTSNSEKKTIWIGDLHHWMDENYLKCSFASVGAVCSLSLYLYSLSNIIILLFLISVVVMLKCWLYRFDLWNLLSFLYNTTHILLFIGMEHEVVIKIFAFNII